MTYDSLDDPGTVDDRDTALKPVPLTDAQKHRAAITVCGFAGRGLDVEIPEHRRAAARQALPLLAALGLLELEDGRRLSPAEAAQRGSRYEHGTGGAVAYHKAGSGFLCDPCARWFEVNLRKPHGTERCGTYPQYSHHIRHKEPVDAACQEARLIYQRERRDNQRRNITAALKEADTCDGT